MQQPSALLAFPAIFKINCLVIAIMLSHGASAGIESKRANIVDTQLLYLFYSFIDKLRR